MGMVKEFLIEKGLSLVAPNKQNKWRQLVDQKFDKFRAIDFENILMTMKNLSDGKTIEESLKPLMENGNAKTHAVHDVLWFINSLHERGEELKIWYRDLG